MKICVVCGIEVNDDEIVTTTDGLFSPCCGSRMMDARPEEEEPA